MEEAALIACLADSLQLAQMVIGDELRRVLTGKWPLVEQGRFQTRRKFGIALLQDFAFNR